jgi:hypothetical protein
MGLQQSSEGKITFVNIKQGKLVVKEKDKEPIYYSDLLGYITKVEFKDDEYNGKKFEVAKFFIQDVDDRFCLQMRTDSGYFRGLVNCLKSGNPKEKFLIKPNYKETDGRPKTTCFVTQEGKVLKHAYTLSNMGDLPPAEKITFKGTEVWDSSKQMIFWKNWLLAESWYSGGEPIKSKIQKEEPQHIESLEDDDLPF